ncbi:hypothetical protein GCM10011374_37090 [Kocuria dechangensis]|uniref:DUF4440 domain-containing protein n=1 Tax=Kocuria dechangensis TaxID=1176249 RepID=A0A917M0S2_9MICC|nr:hypothetical protein [Kocuria dechangensis]GGG69248.1 hypothetical protein GCM10011374_37090 [Kocuria dechangensis]
MSHRPRLITALAVCVLPLAACSWQAAQETSQSSSTAPAPEASPPSAPTPEVPGDGTFPQVQDVDRTDVESTARTAAILLHSWDTAVDRTETAAAIRATPLMSEEWADAQVEPARNSSHGEWLGPAEHRAYSRAQAVPAIGDASADVGEDRAVRAYEVSWRWASRDGEPAPGTGSRQVTIYLEKHSGAWEVVGHQSQEMAAGEAGS